MISVCMAEISSADGSGSVVRYTVISTFCSTSLRRASVVYTNTRTPPSTTMERKTVTNAAMVMK